MSSENLRQELSRDLVLVRDLVKAKSRNKLGVLSASVGRELLEKYALMFSADEHDCDGKVALPSLPLFAGSDEGLAGLCSSAGVCARVRAYPSD